MALHRCPPVRPLRGQLLTRLRCRHRVAVARLAHHVRTSAIHHCISFLPTRYSLSVLHLLSRYLPEIGPSDRPPRSLGSFAAANTDIEWHTPTHAHIPMHTPHMQIGRASCRERVCQYV